MPIIYSKVSIGPSVEPVDLDDIAKIDLRVDDHVEDDVIDIMIKAARQRVESILSSSLITQTRVIKLDYFPRCNTISIPYGPLQEITEVKYFDSDDAEIVMPSSDYWVDIDSRIPRLVIKESWPGTFCRPNAVTLTYRAGYGDAGEDIPADIRKALLYLVAHFYENRQAVIVSGSSMGVLEVPLSVDFLLANHVRDHSVIY